MIGNPPTKSRPSVGQRGLRSLAFKTLVCLGIMKGVLFTHSQAADLDPRIWARNFTNLCLQEAYSKANAVEALFFSGQTANSLCGCGGEMMGATLTIEETAFYSAHKQMRGDTKMRWRKGLVQCMNRNMVLPVSNAAAPLGG